MTPYDYNETELAQKLAQWLKVFEKGSPFAAAAWKLLAPRGYVEKPAAGKRDHHGEGLALQKEWQTAVSAKAGNKGTQKQDIGLAELEAAALRKWVRDNHAQALGIHRSVDEPALQALPTLGELAGQPGLQSSAEELIGFFSNAAVLGVLGDYGFGPEVAQQGQALLDKWTHARTTVVVTRGTTKGKMTKNMSAREKAQAWLGRWWSIVKVLGKDEPGLLAALGVDLAVRKPRAKAKAKPVAVPA